MTSAVSYTHLDVYKRQAYNSPEDLTICTLENAIYMNFKNDISFLLDSEMNLYEHQGSYNPNMPLRDLVYIAKQLEKYTKSLSLIHI